MDNTKIIEEIKKLTEAEKRNLPYEKLKNIINGLNTEEIKKLSNVIGYPVFIRMCMGELRHKIPILQDGSAAIIENL